MNNKLPAIQFYPNDWRGDIGVQSLSYHDRGVWLEILFLMHSSNERGKLLINGKPMPNEVLARHLALDKQKLEQTIENLISYGVASIDEDTGALMNRRMVKDEYIRQIRKEAGAKGGNPNLVNQNESKTASKNQPLHLSSSSSTTKKKKETTIVVPKKVGCRIPDDFEPTEEMVEWAKTNTPGVSISLENQKFKNYYKAKSGKDAAKLDWEATWQNWLINAQEWSKEKTNGKNNDNGFSNKPVSTPANTIKNRPYRQHIE